MGLLQSSISMGFSPPRKNIHFWYPPGNLHFPALQLAAVLDSSAPHEPNDPNNPLVSSSAEAEAWGLAKEAIDAMGKSGYSFADLAANRAGIRFAERVLAGAAPTAWLAERFSVNDFAPDLAGLPEGLSASEVVDRYGGVGDPRFEALRKEIEARIDRLPPYALDRLLLSR